MKRLMEDSMTYLIPGEAIHPGEHIRDELGAVGMSQVDLARRMGVQPSQLNELIHGKRAVTATVALLLERVLGIDAEYWMNLQTRFELSRARIEANYRKREAAIAHWARVEESLPIKYLKKQGVLTGDPVGDLDALRKVYGVENVEVIEQRVHGSRYERFRESGRAGVDVASVFGWMKLARHKADEEGAGAFQPEAWPDLERSLRGVLATNREVKRRTKEVLAEFGVKLIYLERAEKAPVDGAAFWSGQHPVIAMPWRHTRLDRFAATLYHQLGHVYLHLVEDPEAEFIDLVRDSASHRKASQELAATAFARNQLIPEAAWQAFVKRGELNEQDLVHFAGQIRMHPAIPFARLLQGRRKPAPQVDIDRTIR